MMEIRRDEEAVPLTADIESMAVELAPLPSSSTNVATHNDGSPEIVEGDIETQQKHVVKRENVPWSALPNKDQLFLLALCRLSEPLSNTCLLPYIYYLMKSVVVDGDAAPDQLQKTRIAELSGILIAVFPLAQLATSMLWARWADAYGRRITILLALLVSALANLGFGFSRGFWTLMFWRTLAGLANGNVGVMRSMTAEIVKERKYQTKAFLLLPLIFNAGMVIGLLLGGVLADPVRNLSWFFGPHGVFNFSGNADGVSWLLAFPYALPAIWNWATLFGSLILAFLGLRETLESNSDHKDFGLRAGNLLKLRFMHLFMPGRAQRYMAIPETEEVLAVEKPSVSSNKPPGSDASIPRHVWTRDVICALVSFGLLPLHNSAFMHIFPIFLSDIPSSDRSTDTILHFHGGLGMRSRSIGIYLSLFGLLGIFLQLFIYPRLHLRMGTVGVFRISLWTFPATYFLAPFLAMLPTHGVLRWAAVALIAGSQIMARTIAIPSTVILLTNSAPAKPTLGRIHGAGNAMASLARCVGPALGGWIYAQGMQSNMVGMVWWFYLFIVSIAALAWSFTMRSLD